MEQKTLSQVARREAASMRSALERLTPDGTIRMSRDQFEKLASLIEMLARPRGCSDPDCFQKPVDGVRWWVPLPEVERERQELTLLRDDNLRLGEMLTPRASY